MTDQLHLSRHFFSLLTVKEIQRKVDNTEMSRKTIHQNAGMIYKLHTDFL